MLAIANGDIAVLRELVAAELARRVAAIDDIIMAQYRPSPSYHTEAAIAAISGAILSLVRSPLADLERKLGAEPVKPAEAPVKVAV